MRRLLPSYDVAQQPSDVPRNPVVGVIEDEPSGDLVDWAEWFSEVETDPGIALPRPAADYLREAREAGQV